MAKKQKYDYFKAYEKLTALAVEESDLLINALDGYEGSEDLNDVIPAVHELERKGDSINHDVFSSAATDFMPPIDREDIVELAHALDNVLDYIEDVVTHMYMYDIRTMPEDALRFADLIKKSCKALDRAMSEFHNFKKSKKFKQLILDINDYEEEADGLYSAAMRRLHTVENDDVMHVLVWSRVYERMERCCDATEHAADIVSTILLKNM
ncbi:MULTISPECIES: DUF47 domain-containing protein [unclassified Adlercreutzia]|uniref:DUF47 domain-containing protein n=1 Tax=unclassified Adlercreutzia TaxID=2636013 RepID=UPI0013EBC65E|nr:MULTISPECIES: DUF47 family protein [unclassified Adlercreutzia]